MTEASEATRRLFFASWPDADTRDALERACQQGLRGGDGRLVPAGKWHATLAFLGSVPDSRLPALRTAATGLAAGPFELVFDGLELWSRPRVLVAVCSRPSAVAEGLVRQLWSRLTPLGLKADTRRFRAHVTLARKVRQPPAGLSMQPVHWPVRDLCLVQSVTDPAGARYEVLERWPLDPHRVAGPGSPVDPPQAPDWPRQ